MQILHVLLVSVIVALAAVVQARPGATSIDLGVTVQLFEWSWSDVAYECENYLSKKGFKAVQVYFFVFLHTP